MQNSKQYLEEFRMFKVAVLAAFACFAGSLLAQEEISRLNTVLDIDALYTPLESKEIHGETAVNLLRELQTKHYSAVEIDDNFSSTATSIFWMALIFIF